MSHPHSSSPSFFSSPVGVSFVSGLFSGFVSGLLLQPLDVLKTSLIASSNVSVSSSQFVRRLFRSPSSHLFSSFSPLWRGLIPSLTRISIGSSIYFSTQQVLLQHFPSSPSSLDFLLIGASARASAVVTCLPITVIKTRQEAVNFHSLTVGDRRIGLMEEINNLWNERGIRGFYRGLFPSVIKDSPYSAVYLALYANFKSLSPSFFYSPLVHQACSAAAASALSTTLFQPLEVIKTRLQLDQSRAVNFARVSAEIFDQQGVRGFYRALMPRIIRRSASNIISWIVYEQVYLKQIGKESNIRVHR
jgi:solute carrier family 25 protein 38